MKKKRIIAIITAVSISLLVGVGAYIKIDNRYKPNQKEESLDRLPNSVNVERGDIRNVVDAGGNVSLSDENNPNSMIITLSVNQYDISKLQVNQVVEINSKVFPEENIKGVITEIANKASEKENPSYEVKVAISKPIIELGEVTQSSLNFRKGPDIKYSVVTQLDKGEKVEILERKNNWVRVKREDNNVGWVIANAIVSKGMDGEAVESKIYKDDVIIREGNSSNSKGIGMLVKDEKVTIIDKKDNWYKIKVNDSTNGWVEENDLVLQKLIDGMSVTGTIIISEKKDILRVPISAIQKDDDGYYVTMEANYDKKYVQVGENDSEYIEVTEGLFENDRVITESLISYDEENFYED